MQNMSYLEERKADIRKLKAGKKEALFFQLKQRYPDQKLKNGMTLGQYVESLEEEIAKEKKD